MEKKFTVIEEKDGYYKVRVDVAKDHFRVHGYSANSGKDAIDKAKEAEYRIDVEKNIFDTWLNFDADGNLIFKDHRNDIVLRVFPKDDDELNKLKMLASDKKDLRVMIISDDKCLISTLPITLGSMVILNYSIVK